MHRYCLKFKAMQCVKRSAADAYCYNIITYLSPITAKFSDVTGFASFVFSSHITVFVLFGFSPVISCMIIFSITYAPFLVCWVFLPFSVIILYTITLQKSIAFFKNNFYFYIFCYISQNSFIFYIQFCDILQNGPLIRAGHNAERSIYLI